MHKLVIILPVIINPPATTYIVFADLNAAKFKQFARKILFE